MKYREKYLLWKDRDNGLHKGLIHPDFIPKGMIQHWDDSVGDYTLICRHKF